MWSLNIIFIKFNNLAPLFRHVLSFCPQSSHLALNGPLSWKAEIWNKLMKETCSVDGWKQWWEMMVRGLLKFLGSTEN